MVGTVKSNSTKSSGGEKSKHNNVVVAPTQSNNAPTRRTGSGGPLTQVPEGNFTPTSCRVSAETADSNVKSEESDTDEDEVERVSASDGLPHVCAVLGGDPMTECE